MQAPLAMPSARARRTTLIQAREIYAPLVSGFRYAFRTLGTQSSLLTMFGAKALLGRTFLPEEDKPGNPPVAILSHGVWVRLFHSDPAIVGRSITLDGKPLTVAGVLSPGFMLHAEVMPGEGPMDKVDIFLPLPLGPDAEQRRGDENYNIVVRLKPGVSVQQAQADIDMGARPGNILSLVVRQGMQLTLPGILAGLIGAAALTRVIASLLFGVSTTDIATFLAVPLLLAAVAFAATVIPAWRATSVDPMVALREE
jgi:MacB-like periplasmic core domain